MKMTLLYVFDNFSNANDARDALLENGFDPAAVRLGSGNDEAGPVAGNFTVGNSHPKMGVIDKLIDKITGGDSHEYAGNYDETKYVSSHQLQIDVGNEVDETSATVIMKAKGGRAL